MNRLFLLVAFATTLAASDSISPPRSSSLTRVGGTRFNNIFGGQTILRPGSAPVARGTVRSLPAQPAREVSEEEKARIAKAVAELRERSARELAELNAKP